MWKLRLRDIRTSLFVRKALANSLQHTSPLRRIDCSQLSLIYAVHTQHG